MVLVEHGIDVETLSLSFSEFLLAEILLFFKSVLFSSKKGLLLQPELRKVRLLPFILFILMASFFPPSDLCQVLLVAGILLSCEALLLFFDFR